MRVSVVICTWNRARLLQQALESIRVALLAVEDEVQVIVVNNNCTDDTDQVIAKFAATLPLQRVFEPKPGLANARNAGIDAAQGDYLIWTDDDVIVDPQWLAGYLSAFARHPEAAFFGGPIRPEFAGRPPAWLLAGWQKIDSVYATRDFGAQEFLIDELARLPYGANFALRMHEQRRIRYDPRFGRQPGNYWLGGDETEALTRLLKDGRPGWWVPAAVVRHWIPAERQTLRYIARYGFGLGQTTAIKEFYVSRWGRVGKPIWLWRAWAAKLGSTAFLLVASEPASWVPAVHDVAVLSGRLYYSPPRQRVADRS